MKQCESCEYYVGPVVKSVKGFKVCGECYRHPPVVHPLEYGNKYLRPKVGPDEFCGEFVESIDTTPAKK